MLMYKSIDGIKIGSNFFISINSSTSINIEPLNTKRITGSHQSHTSVSPHLILTNFSVTIWK